MLDKRLAIMSWDPGGTTGWAALSIKLGHIPLFAQRGLDALQLEVMDVSCGQLHGSERKQIEEALDLVHAGVASGRADYVVFLYEDFILRKFLKNRALLSPVRMTAKLEVMNYLCWGFVELKQQPSLAKTAMPDSILRQYLLYKKGQPHANDAIRHGVTLVRRFAAKPEFLEATIARSQLLTE